LFSACRCKRIRGPRGGGLQPSLSTWYSGTIKRSRKTSCVYNMDYTVSYKRDQMSLHMMPLPYGIGCWCSDCTTVLVQNDITCNSCTHLWSQLVQWINWNYIFWQKIAVPFYCVKLCVQFGTLSIVNVIELCFRTRMYISCPVGNAVQFIFPFYSYFLCSVLTDLYITGKINVLESLSRD
jgi:hypothetical protein